MVGNKEYAKAASQSGLIGTPYEKLDCQAFVEKTLSLVGIKRNWLGSNDQWRNALSWKGTIDECIAKYGCVPPGAWLFTIKYDGKEPSYYKDGVNASHVGLYVGDYGAKPVMHSTTGGVQWGSFPDPKRWTHVGLEKDIEFATETAPAAPEGSIPGSTSPVQESLPMRILAVIAELQAIAEEVS